MILRMSNAVCWDVSRPIDKSSDSVRITRWMIVTELYTQAALAEMSAVLMEAADGSRQARIPAVTLRHCLRHRVYPLSVCECLVVKNFPRFCDAKYSYFSTCV